MLYCIKHTASAQEKKVLFGKCKCLRVYDWIIIAVFVMFLACYMLGNSSSNPY